MRITWLLFLSLTLSPVLVQAQGICGELFRVKEAAKEAHTPTEPEGPEVNSSGRKSYGHLLHDYAAAEAKFAATFHFTPRQTRLYKDLEGKIRLLFSTKPRDFAPEFSQWMSYPGDGKTYLAESYLSFLRDEGLINFVYVPAKGLSRFPIEALVENSDQLSSRPVVVVVDEAQNLLSYEEWMSLAEKETDPVKRQELFQQAELEKVRRNIFWEIRGTGQIKKGARELRDDYITYFHEMAVNFGRVKAYEADPVERTAMKDITGRLPHNYSIDLRHSGSHDLELEILRSEISGLVQKVRTLLYDMEQLAAAEDRDEKAIANALGNLKFGGTIDEFLHSERQGSANWIRSEVDKLQGSYIRMAANYIEKTLEKVMIAAPELIAEDLKKAGTLKNLAYVIANDVNGYVKNLGEKIDQLPDQVNKTFGNMALFFLGNPEPALTWMYEEAQRLGLDPNDVDTFSRLGKSVLVSIYERLYEKIWGKEAGLRTRVPKHQIRPEPPPNRQEWMLTIKAKTHNTVHEMKETLRSYGVKNSNIRIDRSFTQFVFAVHVNYDGALRMFYDSSRMTFERLQLDLQIALEKLKVAAQGASIADNMEFVLDYDPTNARARLIQVEPGTSEPVENGVQVFADKPIHIDYNAPAISLGDVENQVQNMAQAGAVAAGVIEFGSPPTVVYDDLPVTTTLNRSWYAPNTTNADYTLRQALMKITAGLTAQLASGSYFGIELSLSAPDEADALLKEIQDNLQARQRVNYGAGQLNPELVALYRNSPYLPLYRLLAQGKRAQVLTLLKKRAMQIVMSERNLINAIKEALDDKPVLTGEDIKRILLEVLAKKNSKFRNIVDIYRRYLYAVRHRLGGPEIKTLRQALEAAVNEPFGDPKIAKIFLEPMTLNDNVRGYWRRLISALSGSPTDTSNSSVPEAWIDAPPPSREDP